MLFQTFQKLVLNGNEFADIALNDHGVAIVPGSSFGDSAEKFCKNKLCEFNGKHSKSY